MRFYAEPGDQLNLFRIFLGVAKPDRPDKPPGVTTLNWFGLPVDLPLHQF
jgi:hypothetical protein